jgi:hypothetical protein
MTKLNGDHIKLSIGFPICGYSEPLPSIAHIKRRQIRRGQVLTVFMRFPKVKPTGLCVGEEVILTRTVSIASSTVRGAGLFDGSFSPPRRQRDWSR